MRNTKGIKEMKRIYVISAIHIQKDVDPDSKFDINHITHTVGWYPSLKKALRSIKDNPSMIAEEGYCKYAVVEEYNTGICIIREKEIWFEYLEYEYTKIDKPKRFYGIINFGI